MSGEPTQPKSAGAVPSAQKSEPGKAGRLPEATPSASEDIAAFVAKARAMSGVPADTSYDLLENLRAQRGVSFDLSMAPGTRLDATSVDRKYQELQRLAGHGMLP